MPAGQDKHGVQLSRPSLAYFILARQHSRSGLLCEQYQGMGIFLAIVLAPPGSGFPPADSAPMFVVNPDLVGAEC